MNILTFDLEDWFHILDHPATASSLSWDKMESRIEGNTDRILSLLDEKNQRATWFCLGWVSKKYPSLIKRIAEKHDIACHSIDHQLLYQMKREDVKKDISDNIHQLEDLSGKKVIAYRAPGFSFTSGTRWIVSVLAEAGIKYDCSIFPMKRNHGGYSAFPLAKPCRISFEGAELREFPMTISTVAGIDIVFSGGGYFRFLPFKLISLMMNKSDYVMTYFHPRDFDPGQPVLEDLPFKRKLMSYTGLKKSYSKLFRLLNDYKFVSVEEAGNSIDWKGTPLVKLENY